MENQTIKQKSFIYNFIWVGILLIGLGIIFAGVGIIIQFVPITDDNFSSYVNGVRQPTTEASIRSFRLIFLVVFGSIGLINLLIGAIFTGRIIYTKGLRKRLKADGVHIKGKVTDYGISAVRINNRPATRLYCSYTTNQGITYLFKSPLLKLNPDSYLTDGQVNIYYDRETIKRYFVDIDGSIGRVYEL